jgi:tetratricopeptide (TPR) repeat protein
MTAQLLRKVAGILIISVLMGPVANSQDRNAVIQAFNDGAKASQTDVPAAIKAFENAISLADQVGETAVDLKQKASAALPGLYVKLVSAAITEKRPAPEIMKAARSAVAVAEKYGTQVQKENASKTLVQAFNIQATGYFAKNDFPNALVTFDSLLAVNPGYVNAIYNKALIYIKLNNSDSFEQTIDSYLEKVKAANDEAKTKQASTLALEYFRAAGSKANQAGKLDDATTLLNKASKYGDDKNTFYYLSDVCNKQKNFDKGLENAQRGLDLETGDAEAKAKFYFQLGIAQEGKGLTAEACGSFRNSAFGPFAEPSKIQLKNLKCQ